jgi:uncharacterized protein
MQAKANALIKETSPYLLQHAYNPVQWQPWEPTVLEMAKAQNKPIILSIGYSACHWCHVMEHESFENEGIAQIMNEYFVCIKVDREERPDIDAIYMDAVQAMGVHGGWPLNVFLMPNLKPFYGGTYFKPQQWAQICQSIAQAFVEQHQQLAQSADGFAQSIQTNSETIIQHTDNKIDISVSQIQNWGQQLLQQVDLQWGGLQKAPKFPMPSVWQFLGEILPILDNPSKESAEKAYILTLQKMAMGGIFDQLAGGFARYSVDAHWFCPHFEKMLYDNAQLLKLYAQAYRLHPQPLFLEVLDQTFSWLQTEMKNPNGLYYAALDADSEGAEGKHYIWQQTEIEELLGPKAKDFIQAYQLSAEGNWHEAEANILWKNQAFLNETFAAERAILMQCRSQRQRPGLDNKLLCNWNGLLLSGLAAMGHIRPAAATAALRLATAMVSYWYKDTLAHSISATKTIPAFLDDYAATAEGLIAMYRLNFDENWLYWAETLCLEAIEKLYDPADGFFYFAAASKDLIARKKEKYDNVIPASNSIMGHVLYDLGVLLAREDFVDMAKTMYVQMAPSIHTHTAYTANWASLGLKLWQPKIEVVIHGPKSKAWASEIHKTFQDNLYILASEANSKLALFEYRQATAHTVAYICHNHTCSLAIPKLESSIKHLKSIV